MPRILKVKQPSDYSRWVGQTDDCHPLVSVIDYREVSPVRYSLNDYDVYALFLRDDDKDFGLTYGCGDYGYTKDSLICVAPGQLGGKEDNDELVELSGWALLFHPDILHNTPLEKDIRRYAFFDYRVNEALHMTDEEKEIVVDILRRIKDETVRPADEVQNRIIVNHIALLLSYCQRFYSRQFRARSLSDDNILARFERVLNDYYHNERQRGEGLPTVQYCAKQLSLSANHMGDIIKKETGQTAGNYIRRFIIREAKNRMVAGLSISETAYNLGFDYPQHFSRFFKREEGISPSDYLRQRKK